MAIKRCVEESTAPAQHLLPLVLCLVVAGRLACPYDH